MLENLATAVLLASCAAAQSAQITPLGGSCSYSFPPPPTLLVQHLEPPFGVGQAMITTSILPGTLSHPTVILAGVSDPSAILPSCGCYLHSSADILAFSWNGATQWLLPPATSGSFYFQAVVLGSAATSCDEAGFPAFVTDAFRVTIS